MHKNKLGIARMMKTSRKMDAFGILSQHAEESSMFDD